MKIKLPNLIIGGYHKAGTTSLFNYLSDHPEVSCGDKKEIHYFTPLRYGRDIKELVAYENHFKDSPKESKYLLDASPSYLYGEDRIVSKIFHILNNPKVIFIFRNPTHRFISYVKKRVSEGTLSDNLDLLKFVNESYRLSFNKDVDMPINRAFREGCYDRFLKHWESNSNNITILYFENLLSNPSDLLNQLCRNINISPKYYENYDFDISNKFQPIRNIDFHKKALKINKLLENILMKNKKLKKLINKIYFSLNKREKEYSFKNYDEAVILLNNLYLNENKLIKERLRKFKSIGPFPEWISKS